MEDIDDRTHDCVAKENQYESFKMSEMKKLNTIILFVLVGLCVFAQSPESSKYLAGIQNSAGEIIANLDEPLNYQDAATKAYVDTPSDKIAELGAITTKVKDYDGNLYSTVKIGDQVWMAENLKSTHYANGDPIPDGTGKVDISGETEPKYWFAYTDDTNNVSTYGRLYTWHTITDDRNVCPVGWHVSTDAEWTTLQNYLGGSSNAGGKMKETGTTHWTSPNTGATNESGFTAFPSGYRRRNGDFYGINEYGNWWSATEFTATLGWSWALYYNGVFIARHDSDKKYAFSVRCIKD
jgi:uncharacterized protein (TIGR02145 family)